MKGIFKKLFLGLFLCALICAGFSKNVKAAGIDSIKVGYKLDDGVEIKVTMDAAATPGATDSTELNLLYSTSASGGSPTVIGEIKCDASVAKWVFTPTSSSDGYKFKESQSEDGEKELTIVADDAAKQKEAIRTCAKKITGESGIGDVYIIVKDQNKKLRVVNPKISNITFTGIPQAYTADTNLNPKASDFEVAVTCPGGTDNAWCIEDEEYTYAMTGKIGTIGVKYMASSHFELKSDGESPDASSKVFKKKVDAVYANHPTIQYIYTPAGDIGISSAFDKGIIIGGKSNPRSITLGGTGWDKYSASKNNSEVILTKKPTSEAGFSIENETLASDGTFKVNPTAAKTGYIFTANVYDKAISTTTAQKTKDFSFNAVARPAKPDIEFDSKTKTYSVKVDKTTSAHVKIKSSGVDITDKCDIDTDDYDVATWDDTEGKIYGWTKGTTELTAKYYGYLDGYEGAPDDPAIATATVSVSGSSTGGKLKFNTDPVCVSEGCEVNLVDFMTTDDKTMYVDLILEGGIAKLGSKITLPEELKNVKIKGTKAGKKTDGITVWPSVDEGSAVTADLKVYPAPSVSTGSSGGFGSFNSSSSSSNAGITVSVPASTYHGGESEWVPSVKYAFVTFNSLSSGKSTTLRGSVSGTTSSDTKTATVSLATVSNEISKIAKGDNDQIYVVVNPESAESDMLPDKAVSGVGILNAFKIELKGDSATYKVNGESVKDYFYAIADQEYTIESVAKNSGDKFQKWEGDESSTAKIDKIKFSSPRTLHAVYGNSSSSSSSSSSSKLTANGTGTGADSEGLDDVPKTGESKTDIWILWTVLLVSILGAGFMIYRRFGVVNAIAQAQADETAAIEQEKIDAEVKEKEDKLRVLKNLRNLK